MLRKVIITGAVILGSSVGFASEQEAADLEEQEVVEVDDVNHDDVEKIDRFALVCIDIEGSVALNDVNFFVKWGNGPWQPSRTTKGSWQYHSFRYPNPGDTTSPSLKIRFDSDLSGSTHEVSYNLEKYASPEENCNRYGRKYRFVRDNDSYRYIDLVTSN